MMIRRRSAVVAFEAFGVRIRIACRPASLAEALAPFLPPDRRACGDSDVQASFSLVAAAGGYEVRAGDLLMGSGLDLDVALGLVDARVRAEVANGTSGWTFVHAGVVAVGGRALAIPGDSFTGKTTLVRALIAAGATYYSDEYAVLDDDGKVHPYPRPLSVRDGYARKGGWEIPPHALGVSVGTEPAVIAVVASAPYRPGAIWEPQRLSAVNAALALFAHTIPARARPAEVMVVLSLATAGAVLLEGPRGEAEAVAATLLDATCRTP